MMASLFFHLFICHGKISPAYFSKLVLKRKYYNFGVFVTEFVTKRCGRKMLLSVVLLGVIFQYCRICYFERSTVLDGLGW